MSTFENRFIVSGSVDDVDRFHRAPETFGRLVPPGLILQIHRQDTLAEGSVNEFTMWMGPIPVYWKAVHSQVCDTGFTDSQESGPLKSWVHRHSYERVSDRETRVVDRIEYQHFGGWRGMRSRLLFSAIGLRILFAWRVRATRRGVHLISAAEENY